MCDVFELMVLICVVVFDLTCCKEKIKNISGFLLIVHGKKDCNMTRLASFGIYIVQLEAAESEWQDTVVPWSHGQELYETCTRRKRLALDSGIKYEKRDETRTLSGS